MFKYKLLIAYDGTHFGGWQIQKNSTSIQALIQEALSTLLRTKTQITGAGRTDAGVHAQAQVAHFTVDREIEISKISYSLNSLLPSTIRILDIQQVPLEFHARYSAVSKTYHYYLYFDRDPFKAPYAYFVPHPIDLALLKAAASALIGTHDFTAFANEAHQGAAAKNAVRTLYRIDIAEEEGYLKLKLEGTGFLYKMVRNIVGTLLDVCAGKIDVDQIPSILVSQDRKCAGKTAPAHGLHLMEVIYEL